MRHPRVAALALATLLTLAIAACGSSGPQKVGTGGTRGSPAGDDHEATWKAKAPSSYSFVYRNAGQCGGSNWFVSVSPKGSSKTQITEGCGTADAVPASIEAVFRLLSTTQKRADKVTVTWDRTYGFPAQVSVDEITNAIDDEHTFSVSDFTTPAAPTPGDPTTTTVDTTGGGTSGYPGDPNTPVSTDVPPSDPAEPKPTASEVPNQTDLVDGRVVEPESMIIDDQDPTLLHVRFWGGIPSCSAAAVHSQETSTEIIVTLREGAVPGAGNQACPDIAKYEQITVHLADPAGSRTITATKASGPTR